ncbi:hypothetical protein NMG60_11015301 [Bertholletia excelsa]
MACLNNEQQGNYAFPRISFSSDFADAQMLTRHEGGGYREPPVSSDFAFSVSGYGMISADEVIFKGKLVPLKEPSMTRMTTLKEELLVEDEYESVCSRPPKGSGRWKERLGLRRGSKKAEKSESVHASRKGKALFL